MTERGRRERASPPLPSLASFLRDEIRDLDSLPLSLSLADESHSERVDPATWNERREVWSLDETGRLQIVVTNRGWDGPARRLTLLYRRP
jgi:hypothetical protein